MVHYWAGYSATKIMVVIEDISWERMWTPCISEQSTRKRAQWITHPPALSNLLFLTGQISFHGTLNPHTLGCVTSREPLGSQLPRQQWQHEPLALPNSLPIAGLGKPVHIQRYQKSPEFFVPHPWQGSPRGNKQWTWVRNNEGCCLLFPWVSWATSNGPIGWAGNNLQEYNISPVKIETSFLEPKRMWLVLDELPGALMNI